MTDERMPIGERARLAQEHVVPEWDPSRAAHLLDRTRARERRRRVARVSAVSAVGLAAAAILMFFALRGREATPAIATPSAPKAPAPEASDSILRFADGSRAVPAPGGELVVLHVHEDETRVALQKGGARFEVTPGLARDFVVEAGPVEVSVVGTVFDVLRRERLVEVVVTEGRVRVAWDGGEAFVSAGQRGVFPRATPSASAQTSAEAEPEVEAQPEAEVAVRSRRRRPAGPTWADLAREDRFDEGWELLVADRSVMRSDDIEDLLVAADVARQSGHLAEAVPYLERALVCSRGDPREQLVTFTLGRVRLAQGKNREAAVIFARARAVDLGGSLASDALAREVQAWSRAGDTNRARELAVEYLQRHPEGTHAATVRRYGGLE